MIRVLAKANKKAEILIHEQIGADWFGDGLTSKRFAQQLKDLGDVDTIKVRINSPGGAVSDGVAIYNALKTHGAQINVVVEGLAASIASIIAMAGDTISMGEGSLMMIHSPWTFAMGSADDMRETADVLDKFESSLVDIYAAKTGLPRDELSALLKAETWLNGEEAVRMGFATEASDGGDEEAAALVQNDHREAFKRFAQEFRQAADVTPQRIAAALFPSANADPKETKMTDEEKRAAEAAQKQAINDAVQAALAANRQRQTDIRNLFSRFGEGHAVLMNECLLDENCTPQMASTKLLDAMAKVQPGTIAGGGAVLVADSRDKFRMGAQNAILARLGLEKAEVGNQYAGRSLVDIAENALRHAGISTIGLTKDGIARKVLALSTSDFPQLLSSTAGKVLRAAYERRPGTWRTWAAKGQVSDFKVHPRIQMGSFNSLATIAENGEYTYGGITEAYENAQAVTKGKGILFTRQMLVNDDLGGFNRRAMLMGDAAARTVNEDAYTSLLSNSGVGPTSTDTGAFFNSTAVTTAGGHANYTSSGTAMSVASLGVGRIAMAKQKDAGLKQTLNITPAVLLTSINKEDTARTLLASETDPSSSNSKVPNIYRNRYEVVADPLIDAATYTNSWYLFADPNGPAAAFEVVFLDGNETPFIDDEVDFDTDALKFKVRLDYGIAIGDWRGAYRNVGA
jgi:ATP-dependent protease ClpP protease subunit